jgi:SagB-type dehydrogenase family enzyme
MFRKKYPLAWTFHRNTSRWPHNVLRPDEHQQQCPSFKELPEARTVALPRPPALTSTLSEAIRGRCSCRRFQDEAISLDALAGVLYWTYGKLGQSTPNGIEMLDRPVPSGGGLYPLELYVIASRVAALEPAIYHYNAFCHLLECVREGAMPQHLLSEVFMHQPYVAEGAFVLIITGIFERSFWKYEDRGYRYMLFEAGHAAQNCNLSAAALGLGSVNLGGFFDADLISFLNLEAEEECPLYAIAVGQPEPGPRDLLRIPKAE